MVKTHEHHRNAPQAPSAGFAGLPLGVVAMAAVLVVLCVVMAMALARQYGETGEDLLRDPAATFGYPPHFGLFSSLGIALLWVTAASAWTACAAGGPDRPSLVAAASLSTLLALDDQFLLHEYYAPQVIAYGEYLLYAFYAGSGLAIAWFNRRRAFRKRHLALPFGLACLAFSIVLDLIGGGPEVEDVVEDLSKFLGLALWSLYWCSMAAHEVRQGRRR